MIESPTHVLDSLYIYQPAIPKARKDQKRKMNKNECKFLNVSRFGIMCALVCSIARYMDVRPGTKAVGMVIWWLVAGGEEGDGGMVGSW